MGNNSGGCDLAPRRFPAMLAGQPDTGRSLGLFLAGRTADDLAGLDRNDLPGLFAAAFNYFVRHLMSWILSHRGRGESISAQKHANPKNAE